jgi:hypothetical protein
VVLFLKGVELELLQCTVKTKRKKTGHLVKDQKVRFYNSVKIFNVNKNRLVRRRTGMKSKKRETKQKTD